MTEREIMGFLNEYLPELQAARQSQNGLCGLGNNLRLKYRDGFGTKFSFYSSVTLQEGRDSRRFLGPWTRNKMREIFADCMDVGLAEVISERRGRGGEREEATMATVKLAATDDINARTLLEQALTLLKQLFARLKNETITTEIQGYNRNHGDEFDEYVHERFNTGNIAENAKDVNDDANEKQSRDQVFSNLEKKFGDWLSSLKKNGFSAGDHYVTNLKAIGEPIAPHVSKTAKWYGLFELLTTQHPVKGVFDVLSVAEFAKIYGAAVPFFTAEKTEKEQIRTFYPNCDCFDDLFDFAYQNGNANTLGDGGHTRNGFVKYCQFLCELESRVSDVCVATVDFDMVSPYLAAIRTKPFILLAGISGTGKSRLVRQLARGCCPRYKAGSTTDDHPLYNKQKPGNFEMIQVRPNWHDSTQLMGYESRVSGKAEFVVKPFVKFLAKAWLYEEEGVPFFLCLDEMNLAPVEQYFAEYLSIIETRKVVDGKVITDPLITFPNETLMREAFKEIYQGVDHDRAEQFINKFIAEGGIPIPQNFIVMGTVNMDETTFSFSRKVLDRAMSFELNEVDMDGGLNADPDYDFGSIDMSAAKCEFTQGFEVYVAAKADCDKVKSFLEEVNTVLDKTPFKIAYRTRNEIMIYCHERTKYGVPLAQALDEATSMKILSRVEGDKRRLVIRDTELAEYNGKPLLDSLLGVILKGLKTVRGGDADYIESKVCSRKLQEMIGQLENGYTSFWTR